MSEFTSEQVEDCAATYEEMGEPVGASMLRAYAAMLDRQAQWPSDEEVERAAEQHMRVRGLGMLDPWQTMTEATRVEYRKAMRAALQSVAPVQASAVPDGEEQLKGTFECPICVSRRRQGENAKTRS